MNEQLSLFGNTTTSQILEALNKQHKAWYYNYSDIEEPEYKVHRYKDGDILLCVYRKSGTYRASGEKILAKSVFLARENNGMYRIAHFDRDVLAHLIDCREYHIILDCFINRTEIIDDL